MEPGPLSPLLESVLLTLAELSATPIHRLWPVSPIPPLQSAIHPKQSAIPSVQTERTPTSILREDCRRQGNKRSASPADHGRPVKRVRWQEPECWRQPVSKPEQPKSWWLPATSQPRRVPELRTGRFPKRPRSRELARSTAITAI